MKLILAATMTVLVALASASGAWAYIKDAEARQLRAQVHELRGQIHELKEIVDARSATEPVSEGLPPCLAVELSTGHPHYRGGGIKQYNLPGVPCGTEAEGIEELRHMVNNLAQMLEKREWEKERP
jgi:hypothetical protein